MIQSVSHSEEDSPTTQNSQRRICLVVVSEWRRRTRVDDIHVVELEVDGANAESAARIVVASTGGVLVESDDRPVLLVRGGVGGVAIDSQLGAAGGHGDLLRVRALVDEDALRARRRRGQRVDGRLDGRKGAPRLGNVQAARRRRRAAGGMDDGDEARYERDWQLHLQGRTGFTS
jgi:hypothetical protein